MIQSRNSLEELDKNKKKQGKWILTQLGVKGRAGKTEVTRGLATVNSADTAAAPSVAQCDREQRSSITWGQHSQVQNSPARSPGLQRGKRIPSAWKGTKEKICSHLFCFHGRAPLTRCPTLPSARFIAALIRSQPKAQHQPCTRSHSGLAVSTTAPAPRSHPALLSSSPAPASRQGNVVSLIIKQAF